MHFVDEPLAKVLLDDIDPAAESYVFAHRGLAGALKGDSDALRHEVKGCSAIHDERCARVVRQYEHLGMIYRVFPPPPTPTLVRPVPAYRPEHVPAQDPGTDVVKSSCSVIIVESGFASIAAEEPLLKRPSGKCPAMQGSPSYAQWMIKVLVRASAEAVQ